VAGGGQPAGQRRALTGTARPSLRARLHRPGKGGHRVPQTPAAERVHDARASPHRYCWLATAHTLGRRNGMHIPGSRPAQAGVRPTLKSTLQRSAPHPARGAVQPLADPVWGPALRRRVRGRRGTQADALAARALLPSWCARAEQGPRESGPGGPPPACTMRTFSPPAAGRACGPDLHEARRRLSAAPQRRRHPLGQSCRVRAPRWHADASRHQRIRPARALLPGAAGGRLCGGG
jgi:hypothetical protein